MDNPVLVEATRGDIVESRHRGAIAVADASGALHLAVGDVDRAIYPRSSIKILQALPLVESGAADAYRLSDAALALACSSHNAEPRHVSSVGAMLSAAGLGEAALECGSNRPARPADLARAEAGGPRAIFNTCSGKHAGMLAFARHTGLATDGYPARDHPVQQAIAAAIEEVIETPLADAPCAHDGCSAPTYAAPLKAFAHGFAKLAGGDGLAPRRADAARRLMQACFAEPFMVAGTDRFCTRLMSALTRRAFVKTGAEGVFCAALPELGLGVAIKCDDGGDRAAEVMMASLIAARLALTPAEREAVCALAEPPIANRAGVMVGALRPTETLRRAFD